MANKSKKLRHSRGYPKKTKKISGPQGVFSRQGILQEALTLHQGGRLREAETLYRQILTAQPDHPDALHYLGLLAQQVGKIEIAVELIERALSIRPDYVEALINLGNALKSQGRFEEAVAKYQSALALQPENADGYYNLGNALEAMGRLDDAAASYRQAVTLKPDDIEARINLGNVLKDLGRLDDAAASYRQALLLKPHYAYTHINIGNVLKDQGRLEEAAASYRQALSIKPDEADVHYNLGIVLHAQGKLDEAVASYRQALVLQPQHAEAHNNLGNALRDQGRIEEAAVSYQRALTLQPQYAEAHYNLGIIYKDQGRLEEAAASYQRALTLQPHYADAHNNLGNVLKDQGRLEEAVASYRHALSLNPHYAEAYSNLLFCLNYRSDTTQEELYKESLQWGDAFQQAPPSEKTNFANSLRADRRLRIGYVSPDFRLHSVAFFIEPVIRAHNREKVEVFCYANVKKPDEVTQRLQTEANHWFSLVGISNDTAAARIRKDRIDILVDLAGHTSNNNLPLFAGKPAPIQVTWLGYPNTTGLKTMDYRFTDAVADPAGEADRLHSEKLIRLEHGFLCYQPAAAAPEVGSLPCQDLGYVTFGSFNNLTKIRPEVVKVWARILDAVPDSRLLLKARQLVDDDTRERFKKMFRREGIAADRLEMLKRVPHPADHLGLYSRVDIALDPFPYNGTTTSCEALWMGVPVVTLLGERHAGRVGASILHRIGLEDLCATTVEKYIELAQMLARDKNRLEKLRNGLRSRMQSSELMNPVLFTSHLEEVYYQMWREYCAESEM